MITVSWALDLVFWEGLWAHPEDEAANIMIFILPWRVIRVVNSKLFPFFFFFFFFFQFLHSRFTWRRFILNKTEILRAVNI